MWTRKRPITITYSGTELTNYQVKFDITYDSDMQSNFNDLRFKDSNDDLLAYWLESYIVSTNAIVWVNIPLISVSGTMISMYYGNNSVNSLSDGSHVFENFDDFNDASREYLGLVYDSSLTGDEIEGIAHPSVITLPSGDYLMLYNTINSPKKIKAAVSSDKTSFSNFQVIIDSTDGCNNNLLAGDLAIYDNIVYFAAMCDDGVDYNVTLWSASASSDLTVSNNWSLWGNILTPAGAGFDIFDVDIVLLDSAVNGHQFWLSVIDNSGVGLGLDAPRYIFYADSFPTSDWIKGNNNNPIFSLGNGQYNEPITFYYDVNNEKWIMFYTESDTLDYFSLFYLYSESINSTYTKSGRIYGPYDIDTVNPDDNKWVIEADLMVEGNDLYIYYAGNEQSAGGKDAIGLIKLTLSELDSVTDWVRSDENCNVFYRDDGALLGRLNGSEDWWGGTVETAPYLYVDPSISDWIATFKFNSYAVIEKSFFGLVVFDDRNNACLFGRSLRGEGTVNNFEIQKIISDVGSITASYPSTTLPAYLKIEKINNIKKFYISFDNTNWSLVHTTTDLSTSPHIGLCAKNTGAGSFIPSANYFTIRKYTSSEPSASIGAEELILSIKSMNGVTQPFIKSVNGLSANRIKSIQWYLFGL